MDGRWCASIQQTSNFSRSILTSQVFYDSVYDGHTDADCSSFQQMSHKTKKKKKKEKGEKKNEMVGENLQLARESCSLRSSETKVSSKQIFLFLIFFFFESKCNNQVFALCAQFVHSRSIY